MKASVLPAEVKSEIDCFEGRKLGICTRQRIGVIVADKGPGKFNLGMTSCKFDSVDRIRVRVQARYGDAPS